MAVFRVIDKKTHECHDVYDITYDAITEESMWERYKLNVEFVRGIKMAVKPCCDFCDKPLELVDGRYVIYRTKELNTRELLPHLCEKCADGLDKIIAESRSRLMAQGEIVQRVTELNKARRERLGTKG